MLIDNNRQQIINCVVEYSICYVKTVVKRKIKELSCSLVVTMVYSLYEVTLDASNE